MQVETITIPEERTEAHEAYRTLRTNLLYSYDAHAIAFTSFSPDEGKSISSYQLALSIATLGKKTILIDGDLRRGSLSNLFKVSRKLTGLSEYLTHQADLVVRKSNVENLHFIVSGVNPPNPTELLSSEEFADLINKLKQAYDFVIVDTPPFTVANDALVVTNSLDGAIIVVRNGFTKRKALKRLQEVFARSNAKIFGVVLNRVKSNSIDSYYGYSYGYGKYDKYY